jgi:FAD/FMN-containing dehydrogenase/SAM-dependent methyltransferase
MSGAGAIIVNDVTGLNPVPVWSVVRPTSIADVQESLRRTSGPVSVGGGHFSMGGQTASPNSLHLDMRSLSGVTHFDPLAQTVRALAGTRWCDLQAFLDPHGLSVKIMQTYANFTVGGSLSVNCHGRYLGQGPVIRSVREIVLAFADGSLKAASPTKNPELFYAAVGGYNAIGVIVEAELDVVPNERLERTSVKMPVGDYLDWFKRNVRHTPGAAFHNADLYPPHYRSLRAVTWSKTDRAATHGARLQAPRHHRALEKYMMWTVTEWPFGKARREYVIDPLLFASKPVHWRNYEAGYDVAELEPISRDERTYVLQEYFVPVDRFDEFVPKISEILKRHCVNAVNVSVRHALADPGSLLAWAREECFAFVLYYKQRTRDSAKGRVAVWTRELVDAAIACGGSYYLPYQVHPTSTQFHRAYPRASELFALKGELDPDFRFRNILWDTYYRPEKPALPKSRPAVNNNQPVSEFKSVFGTVEGRDRFYRFLQTVFHLYPEDRLHRLIAVETERGENDEAIYRAIQAQLPSISPRFGMLTHALPALATQKREMVRQTAELLNGLETPDGYLEIGTTGRYLKGLRRALNLGGPVHLLHSVAPTNSPVDIVERGGLRSVADFIAHRQDAPIGSDDLADASVGLVTCYPGLHHMRPDTVAPFLASVARVLRPGGHFVLRDHHVPTEEMRLFVALVHTVFNCGTSVSWKDNAAEPRYFNTLDHWRTLLRDAGLEDRGSALLQANDPSDNTLMAFRKCA